MSQQASQTSFSELTRNAGSALLPSTVVVLFTAAVYAALIVLARDSARG